jgi:hypothetical protein
LFAFNSISRRAGFTRDRPDQTPALSTPWFQRGKANVRSALDGPASLPDRDRGANNNGIGGEFAAAGGADDDGRTMTGGR